MPPILKLKKFLNILDQIDEEIVISFQKLKLKERNKFIKLYQQEEGKKIILNYLNKSGNKIDEEFFRVMIKKL
ncbi:MAG: hypothetical protein ACO34I_05245 [Methylophilaceae bacterium]